MECEARLGDANANVIMAKVYSGISRDVLREHTVAEDNVKAYAFWLTAAQGGRSLLLCNRSLVQCAGLFCSVIGLFRSIIGLFRSIIGLFCSIIGRLLGSLEAMSAVANYLDGSLTSPAVQTSYKDAVSWYIFILF